MDNSLDGSLDGGTHRRLVRVYFEDTDFSGVVYHGSFVRFFERGRSDFMRCLGISHAEFAKDDQAFAVANMTTRFVRPAGIDDLLEIETKIDAFSMARLVFGQKIFRHGELLVEAQVTVALIKNGRPQRIPTDLFHQLSQWCAFHSCDSFCYLNIRYD